MTQYKEIRVCYYDDLRALCIRNNYYTGGTCEEYENLFNRLKVGTCSLRNLTTEALAEIATDIKEHSNTDHEITDIMYELARACTTCFDIA